MSDTDLISGYGPLEVFFGAQEGVSFKADNGRFLSAVLRNNVYGIEAAKRTKDEWCRFFVEKLDNGKVRVKDRRGVYLSRIERHGRNNIEAEKPDPDIWCEFQVFTRNRRVVFKADNGQFLSRIYWTCTDVHNLEAAKEDADMFCEFVPETGNFTLPGFEIVRVDIDDFGLSKKRKTMKEKEYVNMTSRELKFTFNLKWEETVTETITWKNAWGLNTTTSATADCLKGLFRVCVCYDDEQGNVSSKEKLISEVEAVTVTVPPNKRITAKLIATVIEDANIPFTATIKETKANGNIKVLTETGTWKGVVYGKVEVEIEELSLK